LRGLPYRLIIRDLPQVQYAFPSAIVPGEKTELTLLGRNLPEGKLAPAWSVQGQALEESKIWATVPKDPLLEQRFTFLHHLPSPSLNARGLQIWPPGLK